MSSSISPRRWYHWFHPDDTPEERKLIWKLDLLVVGYAFIVYWVSRMEHWKARNRNPTYLESHCMNNLTK
jgi:valyl-tRNA synthetase